MIERCDEIHPCSVPCSECDRYVEEQATTCGQHPIISRLTLYAAAARKIHGGSRGRLLAARYEGVRNVIEAIVGPRP